MRYAIFSDLHDHTDGLDRVEQDAQRRHVDRLLYLGDTGHTPALFDALRARDIPCTFGNWEVSGMARLPATLRTWVAAWPAMLPLGDVVCCHASPDVPDGVHTTAHAATYMRQGVGWHAIFPRLHTQEEARWTAWAALQATGRVAAFHGHTHVQQVWRYADRRWQSFYGPAEFTLDATDATAYLIGVGSAGAPQDGTALRYAVYDDASRVVTLVALP